MATLIDSYSETNQNTFTQLGSGSYTGIGQSFVGDGNKLDSCKFYIRKTGSPTGNAVAKLYAHTGTYGSTGTPTGSALATSANFDVSTLTTSYQLITFTFDGTVTMTNATNYFIVVEYSTSASPNLIEPGFDSTSPTHAGNQARNFGGWTANSGADCIFYVYNTVSPSSIKTVNGLTYASAKTVNGLAVASVKTIDGLA